MPDILPRLDAHPEHHTRAWLYEDEERILDAHTCRDLDARLTVSVLLAEHRTPNGGRKRASRAKLTEEQRERESRASDLLNTWANGAYAVGALLSRLACARREAHYAKLGQQVPPVPAEAARA